MVEDERLLARNRRHRYRILAFVCLLIVGTVWGAIKLWAGLQVGQLSRFYVTVTVAADLGALIFAGALLL